MWRLKYMAVGAAIAVLLMLGTADPEPLFAMVGW